MILKNDNRIQKSSKKCSLVIFSPTILILKGCKAFLVICLKINWTLQLFIIININVGRNINIIFYYDSYVFDKLSKKEIKKNRKLINCS